MLNFSHFNKISEDDKKAVLRHPKGHVITIAKQALSPKMRSQLDRLPLNRADGGDESVDGSQVEMPPQAPMASQMPSINIFTAPQPNASNARTGMPVYEGAGANPSPLNFTSPEAKVPNAPIDQASQFLNRKFNPEYKPVGNVTPQSEQPDLQTQPQQAAAPQNPSILQQRQPTQDVANPDLATAQTYEDAYMGGLNKQVSGEQALANAQGVQGQQEAAILNQRSNYLQQAQQDFMKHYQPLHDEAQAVVEDLKNSKINPNQFWDNKSTFSKITTALGMIVAGAGAGAIGQENPLMKYLNQQIDRNIDAQMNGINNKKNVLSALNHQMGNLHDATQMFKSINLDMYASELGEIAAQTKSPVAQAEAQKRIGELQKESAAIRSQIAGKKVMAQMAGGPGGLDPSMMVRMRVPENRQQEAYKEVKDQQNINAINKNAMESFDNVAKMQTVWSRLMDPIQSASRIDAEWDPMIDKITKLNEGRVTPITVEMINSLKPLVRDDQGTLNIKRQKLLRLLSGERSSPVLDSYRIPIDKSSSASARQQQIAGWKK